jgi:hypothetical protein
VLLLSLVPSSKTVHFVVPSVTHSYLQCWSLCLLCDQNVPIFLVTFHKTVDDTSVNCHDLNCYIFAVCSLSSAKRNTFMFWQHYYNIPNMVPPVPWTVPAWQQSAPKYGSQFGPLYILCTKEFPAALHMRDQYIERWFLTIYCFLWWLTNEVQDMGVSGFWNIFLLLLRLFAL